MLAVQTLTVGLMKNLPDFIAFASLIYRKVTPKE